MPGRKLRLDVLAEGLAIDDPGRGHTEALAYEPGQPCSLASDPSRGIHRLASRGEGFERFEVGKAFGQSVAEGIRMTSAAPGRTSRGLGPGIPSEVGLQLLEVGAILRARRLAAHVLRSVPFAPVRSAEVFPLPLRGRLARPGTLLVRNAGQVPSPGHNPAFLSLV